MIDQSMRAFLSRLEMSGALHRVKRPTDPKFEIGAVLALRDRGPAILFEQTGSLPVVGNLLVSRERFALGLNVHPRSSMISACTHSPIP
jgi:2,5-furandicarboxylate decarboxylase 1